MNTVMDLQDCSIRADQIAAIYEARCRHDSPIGEGRIIRLADGAELHTRQLLMDLTNYWRNARNATDEQLIVDTAWLEKECEEVASEFHIDSAKLLADVGLCGLHPDAGTVIRLYAARIQ